MTSQFSSSPEEMQKADAGIQLARWVRELGPSVLQRMLESAKPDLISFALGLPSPDLFPREACMRAVDRVASSGGPVFQYAPPLHALKTHIVELMRLRGVECTEDQVFLTTGAQQGMSLLTRLILPQHGKVLVDEFTYTGFLQAVAPFEPQLLTVGTHPDLSMDVDSLERVLRLTSRPALIYTIPDGHNPLGRSLGRESRLRLVELAARYQVPVIEDDASGFLSYDSEHLPPLRALDDKWVLYLGSFSKILAPSFRTGWIVAPRELITKLSIVKEATDINASPFSQRIVAAYLDEGGLKDHIAGLRVEYRSRRDAMVERISESLNGKAKVTAPSAGVFMWLELNNNIDSSSRLLEFALETENIAFVPGSAFTVNKKPSRAIRLNFSHPTIPQIREGIGRLARAVEAFPV